MIDAKNRINELDSERSNIILMIYFHLIYDLREFYTTLVYSEASTII